MASLSNINGLFDVHSTGAILFSTSHGTSGQILRSNGNAAPTWVAASTVIGGPYLPLSGGTLTGATATATGISFTVGGTLTGTSATFTGLVSGITPTAAANFATKDYVDSLSPPGGPYVTIGTTQTITANKTFSTLTYFTASESIRLKGIRGQFTNDFIHLYNKVGIGNPAGWGQGETSTPNQGLSVFGGSNFAYGTSATSTFYGPITATGKILLNANNINFESAYSGNGLVLSHHGIGPSNAIVSGNSVYPDTLFINNGGATSDWSNVSITGSVGIGTPTPQQKLHVNGNVRVGTDTGFIDFARPGGVIVGGIGWDTDNYFYVAGHPSAGTTAGNSVRVYAFGSLLSLGNPTAGDALTVAVNGNVGIGTGTDSPAAKLHVKGGDISVEETGGNGNKIFFTTDHNSHLIMSNGYWIDIIGNAYEVFRVFGGASTTTEFLRVTGSGYTKLMNDGDTTWQAYNFHAITQSRASEPTLMIYNSASTGNQYGVNVIHKSTSANTTGRFFLGSTNDGATEKIKIYTNGDIQNTNNSYTQLSDLSLKENVVDATDKLEEVKKLRVINWNFIGDDLKQIGVAAQEVEKIFPGLVNEVEHNQDGETSMVKSVKYSVFVPILIKAIQELEARVKELENK